MQPLRLNSCPASVLSPRCPRWLEGHRASTNISMISCGGQRRIVSLVNSSNSAPSGEASRAGRIAIPRASSRSGRLAASSPKTRKRGTTSLSRSAPQAVYSKLSSNWKACWPTTLTTRQSCINWL